MKKRVKELALAALLGLLLTACGGAQTQEAKTEAAAQETTAEKESVTETAADKQETAIETTTAEPETETPSAEETAEAALDYEEKYPSAEGWFVSDGLAVDINGYYFNETDPEIMLDGMIRVTEEGETISPSQVLEIHVYQDGYELHKESGADLDEPLTSESMMPLEDIYHTESFSDAVKVEAVFKSGTKHTWTQEDMWK